MKGKPLHALKFFLHLACKAKEKKVVCILISIHKNIKNINTTKILPETVEYYNQSDWRAWMHWTRWLDTILIKVHLPGYQMLCFSA